MTFFWLFRYYKWC